jgi:hypothetical protein
MIKYGVLIIIVLSTFLSMQKIGGVNNRVAVTHAVVELSERCLIGGVQGQKWVAADRFAKSLRGTSKYSLYNLKGPAGEITVSKIAGDGDCGADEWSAHENSKAREGIAVASPTWNVMPRIPRAIDLSDTTYVKVISDILKREGIRKPEVKITQAYKIDLDGDGKDEVVLVANRYARGFRELSGMSNLASAGDYTLVLVRKMIGEKIRDIFLVKTVWLKGSEEYLPRGNHVSAIADLNGDGVMELVLYSAYHEGSSSDVVEIRGARATDVLECGCER